MSLTVVIPTRDRVALLREAIESVLASPLVRSPRDVVVIDDGSQDETPAAARDFGVRYARISGGGISHAFTRPARRSLTAATKP